MLGNLPPDIQTFLLLLVSTPAALFTQLEGWDWFAALPSQVKWGLQIGASGIAAAVLTAVALGVIPANVMATANSTYLTIAGVIAAILVNFGTHISVNKLAKPAGKAMTGYAASKGVGIGPKG